MRLTHDCNRRRAGRISCSLLRFCTAAALLGGAGLGLHPGVALLAERYRKESVPIRKSLGEFDPSAIPSFVLSETDFDFLFNFVTEDLGTDEHMVVNLLRKDSAAPYAERQAILFVTYYSDPDDRVPHTPEVCYRQGGTVIDSMQTITLDTPELAPEHPQIEIRLLLLDQQNVRGAVAYVFYINGEFCYDREQVRWLQGWPGPEYVYFSKIETVASFGPQADPGPAIERATLLMREALPVLVHEHFPDDAALRARFAHRD